MESIDRKIVIIIPARYESTRFPGKPLALIAGKPMIQHVWERCRQSKLANRILIATDNDRIFQTVLDFGGEAAMTPSDLASGTERVAYAAEKCEGDIFVNVQGDEPLISPTTIDATILPLLKDRTIDIGTAACPITILQEITNPNIVKVVCTNERRAMYFSRTPIPYCSDANLENLNPLEVYLKHIGIYAFRRDSLMRFSSTPPSVLEKTEKLEQLRALQAGMVIYVAEVEHDSIAVDIPEDIKKILAYLENTDTRTPH